MRRLPFFIAFALVASTGCAYRYRFETGLPPQENAKVTEWRHIFFWGWSEPPPFDLDAACPNGVAEFGSYVNMLTNWPCALLTLGFYSPRTVYAIPARATAGGAP